MSYSSYLKRGQSAYDKYRAQYLGDNGSDRTTSYDNHRSYFGMSTHDIAQSESRLLNASLYSLQRQYDEALEDYTNARMSGDGTEIKFKQQMQQIEQDIKETQLDLDAADNWLAQYDDYLGGQEAFQQVQDQGLTSMDWYDRSEATVEYYQERYDQIKGAIEAADIHNKGAQPGHEVQTFTDEDLQRAAQDLEAAKQQLTWASRYRWDDLERTPEDMAQGEATYQQQHEAWAPEYERVRDSILSTPDFSGMNNMGGALWQAELALNQGYKEPTDKWSDEQREIYYVLLGDGSDTTQADQYAIETNNRIQQAENYDTSKAIQDYATDGFWQGALSTLGAAGAGLLSGAEFLADVNEYAVRGTVTEKDFGLNDYNQAVTSSISNALNREFGTAEFLGKDVGLGDAYQVGVSIAQSWAAMAMTGGSSVFTNTMFFGQAAKSTFDEQIANGADTDKAILLGVLSGAAEVVGEIMPLDNLRKLSKGETQGLIKDILWSGGIEGGGEFITSFTNTIADAIVNGDMSDYNIAVSSYISQGMSYEEAQAQATKDVFNTWAYDALAGSVSGGVSGGVIGPGIRAAQDVATSMQPFEGDSLGLIDAASSMDGGVEAPRLATRYADKLARAKDADQATLTNRQADKLTKAIEKDQANNTTRAVMDGLTQQLQAQGMTQDLGFASDTIFKAAQGVASTGMALRGSVGNRQLTSEEAQFLREMPEDTRALVDDLARVMDDRGQIDPDAITADSPAWIQELGLKSGQRIAFDAAYGDVLGDLLAPEQPQDSAQPDVQTQAPVDARSAPVAAQAPRAANMTVSQLVQGRSNAGDYASLYDGSQTPDAYVAAMDAAIYSVARSTTSKEAFLKSDAVQSLTPKQQDYAWRKGQALRRQASKAAQAKARQDSNKTEKPKRKRKSSNQSRLSYTGVKVGDTVYRATSREKVSARERRVLEAFARAADVEIVFYESQQDSDGQYTGANGFYYDGVVYLDVNAGKDKTHSNNAVLLTAAHELTHFIRDKAPVQYEALQDFVVTHVLKNEDMSFDALVQTQLRLDPSLTYDGAVEEVVANACEMVLQDSQIIQTMAKENQTLYEKIRDWLIEFAEDLRAAFEGQEARHDEAKAMLDYMDQLVELWDSGLREAGKSGGSAGKGERRYSYAGRKASTADTDQLAHAEVLEAQGKTNEEIRQETGWFRGMDGEWRFEVDDSRVKVYTDTISYIPRRLSDVLMHPALFDAYPTLEDVWIVTEDMEPGDRGYYSDGQKTLAISSSILNDMEEVKATILHEVQHAIQRYEGFAIGANLEYWEKRIAGGFDARSRDVKQKQADVERELESIRVADPELFDELSELYESAPDVPRGEVDFETLEQTEPDPPEWQEAVSQTAKFRHSYRDSSTYLTPEQAKEQAKAYTRLQAENRYLRQKWEYWKAQTKLTNGAKTVREKDVRAFAKRYLKKYASTLDLDYVVEVLTEVGNEVVRGDWHYTYVTDRLYDLAKDMVEEAEIEVDPDYDETVANELKSDIRNTKFYIDQGYMSDLDEGFRKRYRNKLHITHDRLKGVGVDIAYMELQGKYGTDLFPDYATNVADLLSIIAEAYDRITAPPDTYNPFAYNMNEARFSLANEMFDDILEGVLRANPPTAADRAQAKLDAQKAKTQEAKDALKEERKKHQDALREERAKNREAMKKLRESKNERIAYIKAHYQDMRAQEQQRRKESAAQRKYRPQILKTVSTLQDWLIKNSAEEHVPEVLKAPVIEFIQSLNLDSKSRVQKGKTTAQDRRFDVKARKLADILTKQKEYMQGKGDGLDQFLDLPDGFADTFETFVKQISDAMASVQDVSDPISLMTGDQLRQLNEALAVISTSIQSINKFMSEGRQVSVIESAKSSVEEMDRLKARDKTVADAASSFLQWSNTVPYYAFKRFGAAGVERFRAIVKGWAKMADNVDSIQKFTERTYVDKNVKDWEGAIRTFTLSDGSKLRITEAQIMGLYCLSRREQGLRHILGGGIRIADIQTGVGQIVKLEKARTFHMTADDLSKVFSSLSPKQIEVAQKLQEFMNTQCSDWGNEISMARFGIRQFTEDFYYPIQTDDNNHPMSDPQARETDIFRLLNMSFTKALTPNANNSVVIHSVFDVFAAHSADMAKYNALALPVLDMMKWYNYKDRQTHEVEDSAGNVQTQVFVSSVKQSIEAAYGKQAQTYFMNFVRDINGVREGGRYEGLIRGSLSRYKAAAVGANIRVAIQQPTSIFRASYVIDPKWLTYGVAHGNYKEALANNGLVKWKAMGYFDTNLARNMRDQIKGSGSIADKITDKSMILAQKGDELTWGALWAACKEEQRVTKRLSGKELIQATNDRFSEVILATQVMDATISRSDIMRSKSVAVNELTSFMSEPTMSYNMLLDGYMEYSKDLRTTGDRVGALRRNFGKIGKGLAVYAVSSVVTSMAAAIVDAMRDDDDYETFLQKWAEHALENIVDNLNPFSILTVVSDLWDLIITGEAPESMYWQAYTQLRDALTSGIDLIQVMMDPDAETDTSLTQWGRLYNVLRGLSGITGIPVAPGLRDAKAIWNSTAVYLGAPDINFYDRGAATQIREALENGYITEDEAVSLLVREGEVVEPDDAYWKVQGWIHADDEVGWTKYSALHSALLAGDSEAYELAVEELTDHGISPTDVRAEIKRQTGKWFTGDNGQEAQTITSDRAFELLTEEGGMTPQRAQQQIDKWQCILSTGIAYDDIDDAYVAGDITIERAKELYMEYGHMYEHDVDEKLQELTMQRETGMRLTDLCDLYVHGDVSEEEAVYYLETYGGYSSDESTEKVLQWSLASSYGITFGSSDNGIKKALIEGYIDEETAKEIMMVYDDRTEEEAEDYTNQYLFTAATGYNWSEVNEAWEDGVITDEEYVEWQMKASIYTHGSAEIAQEYLEVAWWKSNVPGADRMNRSGLEKWEAKGSRLRAAGLDMEDFAKAWEIYSTSNAEYDENGNKVKEKAQVAMERLGQLEGYTRNQLTNLGYSIYSARKVNSYKTW